MVPRRVAAGPLARHSATSSSTRRSCVTSVVDTTCTAAALRHCRLARSDRLHPDDAFGRGEGRGGGGCGRHPVLAFTVGTATPEDAAAANPTAAPVPALHVADQERSMDVMAESAERVDTPPLTVDVPIGGSPARSVQRADHPADAHPAHCSMRLKVRWWLDFLTTEPIGFSTFKGFHGTVAELLDLMFNPTVDSTIWCGPRTSARQGDRRGVRRWPTPGGWPTRCGFGAAVQPRRPPTGPGTDPVPLLPEVTRTARRHRGVDRHGHHVRAQTWLRSPWAPGSPWKRAYLYGLMAGGRRCDQQRHPGRRGGR